MKKSVEGALHKTNNYLFPEMPRYCCPAETFYFDFFSFKKIQVKFKTAFENRQAGKSPVKYLSQ